MKLRGVAAAVTSRARRSSTFFTSIASSTPNVVDGLVRFCCDQERRFESPILCERGSGWLPARTPSRAVRLRGCLTSG